MQNWDVTKSVYSLQKLKGLIEIKEEEKESPVRENPDGLFRILSSR